MCDDLDPAHAVQPALHPVNCPDGISNCWDITLGASNCPLGGSTLGAFLLYH